MSRPPGCRNMVNFWRWAARVSAPSSCFARSYGKGAARITRCTLASWYVDPEFRAYAPMLVARAIRHKDVTYTNVSPAPHTRPIIEAQGFSRYSDGVFVAITALNGLFGGRKAEVIDAVERPDIPCDPFDSAVLLQPAGLGCDSVWCVGAGEGVAFC